MGTPEYKYVGEFVKSQFERGRNALEEGVYDRAIEFFASALRARGMNPEIEAEIRSNLSEAYEEDSNGKEALLAVDKYESLPARESLPIPLQAMVWLRMGLAYHRLANHPKAISYLNTSLKLAEGLNDPSAIGQANLALGRSYWKVEEYQIAHVHLDTAAESFRQVGDRRLLAQSCLANGIVLIREGKYEEAVTVLESAERLISDKPYYSLLGQILQNLAVINGFQQRSHEAMAFQERSVFYFKRAGQQRFLVAGLNNLGFYLFSLGEVDRAQSEWKQAVELAHEIGYLPTEAMALDGLSQIDTLQGNYDAAREKLQSALAILANIKSKWYEAQVRQSLTRLYCDQGDVAAALDEGRNLLALAEEIGDGHGVLMAQLSLAEAEIVAGKIADAEILIASIDERTQDKDDLLLVGLSRRIRSKIYGIQGQGEESVALAAQSVSAFEALGHKYQTALSQMEWGKALLRVSNPIKAREALQRASVIFEALGAEPDKETVRGILRECEDVPERSNGNSEASLKSAERLLNAVLSRDLLIHELVSVLRSLPEVRNAAVFELSPENPPALILTQDWNVEEAHRRLAAVRMNPSLVSPDGCTRMYWLDPARGESRERAALLVETVEVMSSGQIGLFLHLAQQGLELCSLRRERGPKLTEGLTVVSEIANSVGLVIGSAPMKQLLESIHRIRSSNVTVLITGESGTGKELVARAVHAESARRDRAFVPFNCTAATRELADSLLFGHRRGAFTGAGEERQGVVRAADGGTLFLDEIGDLGFEVQPKLLRFLQEGEVQPLGVERPIKVDVRVVAATNAELEQLVEQGRFREDLFHRLNVIRLRVPALRERREEVPILARHFLGRFAQEAGKRLALSDEATDLLQVYDWPGNIRQLSNEVHRMVALAEDGATITHHHLSPEVVTPLQGKGQSGPQRGGQVSDGVVIDVHQPMSDAVSQLEREMLLGALRQNNGNISKTARQLGLTRRGLHMKRERLGIQDFAADLS